MNVTISGRIPDDAVRPVQDGDAYVYVQRDYLTLDDLRFFDDDGEEVFVDRSNWTGFAIKVRPADGSLVAEISMRFNVNAAEINPAPLVIRNGAIVPQTMMG